MHNFGIIKKAAELLLSLWEQVKKILEILITDSPEGKFLSHFYWFFFLSFKKESLGNWTSF